MARIIIIPFNKYLKASLAITGAIKGSSTKKLYQDLGLESLQNRRQFQKLRIFYKTFERQPPKYLLYLIPSNNNSYQTRNSYSSPVQRKE